MEIARAVEPGLSGKVKDVHDQRITIPPPACVSHPPIDGAPRVRRIHVYTPDRVSILVSDDESSGTLNDVEWKSHVGRARNPRQIALRFGVGGRTVGEVLLFLLQRPGLIRDFVTL